jgi:hypothetical protein
MRNRLTYVIAVLIFLLPCAPVAAQPSRCSARTVVGTYALSVQGSTLITSPGAALPTAAPFASLAIVSIDRTGRIAGTGYAAFAGQIGQSPFEGTIDVNPDCTATVRTSAGTASVDVILDGGDQMKGLLYEFPVGKPLLQGVARRLSHFPAIAWPRRCSQEDARGTYAVTHQGTYLMPAPVPALTVALASIDDQGQVSGAGTISMAGTAMPYEITRGRIEVNADCTAVLDMSVKSGALEDAGKAWMILLDGGNEIWAIQTDSLHMKPIVAGVWTRSSPRWRE